MAPKRAQKRKKVVGTVTRTKIVRETVEVSVVEKDTQESAQQGDQNEEKEDFDIPATLPSSQEEQNVEAEIILDIPAREDVDQTVKVTIPVSGVETNKTDANNTGVPQEEDDAARREEEKEEKRKKENQTSEISQEQPSREEGEASKEEPRKEPEETHLPSKEEATKKVKTKEGKESGIKKGTQEGKGNDHQERRKKRKRSTIERGEGYKRYVFRVLKQVHPELRISSMAMRIINSLMNDMFERIADEAAKLLQYSQKATLSSKAIQDAVKLVLPGELGKHAIAEGSKAVTNYMSYEAKKSK